MKIALTGSNGRVGGHIRTAALRLGHELVCVDRTSNDAPGDRFVQADVTDYDALVAAFEGCDALIHMAAIPTAFRDPDHVVHANNVVGSYNAMRAAIEVGIRRICQASSVNAIGLSYSRAGHFDYFPIDERHPCHAEEPYGLSKWICEQQAESLVRRHDHLSIASMRFHWVVPRTTSAESFNSLDPAKAKHLWAYSSPGPAAEACLLSLAAPFTGHETFYVVSPTTVSDVPSMELAARFYPDVPIRGDLSGHRSFFDSSKAERILGWSNPPET
jgi:UDP-glucose 4-epimerase